MPDTNNPPSGGNGEAVPTRDIVDELADILDDPEPDNDEDEAETAATKPKAKSDADEPDEGEAEDDKAGKEAEDPDADKPEQQEDGPESAAGRFVAHDGRVRLSDGTLTTVKELIDGSLRQGDYTRKTQEVSELRKTFEAGEQRVSQLNQQLEQQLALNAQWLEMTKPERPAVPYSEDPIAHGEYQDAMQRWQEARQWIGQHAQSQRQAMADRNKEALAQYEKREDEALRSAIPALRDPAKFRAFVAEVEKIAPEYGIAPDELKGVKDHRQWLVLRDALAYRRLKARQPEVRKAIESKPALIQGRKRQPPQAANTRARQDRTERLRREGSFDDGVAALMDMDL